MSDFKISSRTDDPFGSTHRYYLTPELSQRVNLIRHLIQNSEQLLFILGETGGGKTALLNQLKKIAEKKNEHWWIYTLTSSPALSKEALISTILAAFNVRQDGKPIQILQDSLRSHTAATRYNGQLPVLFVDDAHKLPLASLKFIIELAMQGEQLTRMRVVLFCEPQITSILATPEFEIVQKNMTHTLDIPPFSANQVRDYLQFRLQNSKYSNVHPFTSDIIKKIYIESEGIPAEINLYAEQVLQQFAEQRQEPTHRYSLSYSKLRWGIPIVLVLMAIAWFVYSQYSKLIKTSPPVKQPSLTSTLSDHALTEMTHETLLPTDLSSHADGTDLTNDSNQSVQTKVPEKPAKITQPVQIAQTEVKETEVKGRDWLLHQNSKAYTLQILGVHDRQTLKKFIAKHHLNDLATFKTTYRNKNWYVLVYGIYPTRAMAEEALAELPASLRQNTQPWARSLDSIQKVIE